MNTLSAVCIIAACCGQTPSEADVCKVVERSLPFLEKEGVAWWEGKKCASCHHVPMMVWTHHIAKQRGFKVNDQALQDMEAAAVGHYIGHPTLQPTGQDKGFFEKPFGAGTVYLSLALAANPTPGDESKQALQKLRANFVKHQNDDGGWTTAQNQPPLVDGHDSTTALIVLASGPDQTAELRAKALQWLQKTPVREESQPLIYRLLALVASRQAKESGEFLEQLKKLQRDDGGWSQTSKRNSDALATGQALYALAAAGVPPTDPAIGRAWSFLAKTQQADGAWLVPTRNANGHDPIISYYGSGWATLGLLSSLPPGTAR